MVRGTTTSMVRSIVLAAGGINEPSSSSLRSPSIATCEGPLGASLPYPGRHRIVTRCNSFDSAWFTNRLANTPLAPED